MAGVKPLLGSDWLSIDKTANQGSGKNPVSPDTTDPSAEAVPVGDQTYALTGAAFDPAPASGEVLYSNDPYAFGSAWPSFAQGDWKQSTAQVAQGRVTGEPDPYQTRNPTDGVVRTTINEYAGFNAHSQSTDTKGWEQNTASGRTATKTLLGANGRVWDAFWPLKGSQPIPRRLALVGVANNDLSKNQIDGSLPDFANTNAGGPGNIAYETPQPPQTATAQPSSAQPDWSGWGY